MKRQRKRRVTEKVRSMLESLIADPKTHILIIVIDNSITVNNNEVEIKGNKNCGIAAGSENKATHINQAGRRNINSATGH